MQIHAKEIKIGDKVALTREKDYKIIVTDIERHGDTMLVFYNHPITGESSIYRKFARTLVEKD